MPRWQRRQPASISIWLCLVHMQGTQNIVTSCNSSMIRCNCCQTGYTHTWLCTGRCHMKSRAARQKAMSVKCAIQVDSAYQTDAGSGTVTSDSCGPESAYFLLYLSMACIQSRIQHSITALLVLSSLFQHLLTQHTTSKHALSKQRELHRWFLLHSPMQHACTGGLSHPSPQQQSRQQEECRTKHNQAAPSAEPLQPALEPAGHPAAQ